MKKFSSLFAALLFLFLVGNIQSAMAQMNAPTYSQRDGRWANDQLGFLPGSTIGAYGCVDTCIAMLRSYYGDAKNPRDENVWLKNHGGFNNDLVIWRAVPGYAGSRNYPKAADLNYINSLLAQGIPVIAETRWPTNRSWTHYVLITGRSGGTYFINDPYYGDRTTFNGRYGDPSRWIYSVQVYYR